jgi:hypothetical protein
MYLDLFSGDGWRSWVGGCMESPSFAWRALGAKRRVGRGGRRVGRTLFSASYSELAHCASRNINFNNENVIQKMFACAKVVFRKRF